MVRINTVDSVTTPIGDLELGRKVNFYGLKYVLGGRTLDGLDGSLRLNCTMKEERALNEKTQNGWVSGNRIVLNCSDSSQINAGVARGVKMSISWKQQVRLAGYAAF